MWSRVARLTFAVVPVALALVAPMRGSAADATP